MGRSFKTLVVLMLVLALMPGLFEAVENGVHLVETGHWAHAETGADHHDPLSPEHGCTPTFHLCGCHASLAGVLPVPSPPSAPGDFDLLTRVDPEAALTQFVALIERPPQV